eukprot:TRINITY_DN2908_c0_g1_i10.p3 TRINITY_DN2908_c0_g1~~TRINITY_DN2908_c0_g1_i10.p3  ORF type:complete len:107 (+),score=7.35 TRINITY_DN2908_c0_g1_i10:41-322(+)
MCSTAIPKVVILPPPTVACPSRRCIGVENRCCGSVPGTKPDGSIPVIGEKCDASALRTYIYAGQCAGGALVIRRPSVCPTTCSSYEGISCYCP